MVAQQARLGEAPARVRWKVEEDLQEKETQAGI